MGKFRGSSFPDFAKGASPQGSHTVTSVTMPVRTSIVTLPATKYGQSGGRKRKSR